MSAEARGRAPRDSREQEEEAAGPAGSSSVAVCSEAPGPVSGQLERLHTWPGRTPPGGAVRLGPAEAQATSLAHRRGRDAGHAQQLLGSQVCLSGLQTNTLSTSVSTSLEMPVLSLGSGTSPENAAEPPSRGAGNGAESHGPGSRTATVSGPIRSPATCHLTCEMAARTFTLDLV